MIGYLMIAVLLVAFCMVANRLSRTIITAPMIFLAFGAGISQLDVLPLDMAFGALNLVAEVALVVLLFLDAAKIDQQALRRRNVWPARMLTIGLPLCVVFGIAAGLIFLPGWPLAVVAVVACVLAPTDAALSQPVVSNSEIPERPRRALTVESGLNDGLALPLVLMTAAILASESDVTSSGWLVFGLKQITLGPLAGLTVGIAGGFVLLWAKRVRATSDIYEGIGALALAAVAYLFAGVIGGNGFIAAFTAGLGFGGVVRGRCAFVYEFTEGEGQLLSWAAFFLLGALLVPTAIADLSWPIFFYILASFFIVRPLAIWLSLVGTDAAPLTRAFFGWFGPRGLATALFALLVAEGIDSETATAILNLAINAVWISALLHGITAVPGARFYASRIKAAGSIAEQRPMQPSNEIFRDRMNTSTRILK